MQSETQLMLSISKGTEAGAPGSSQPEKKEDSGAAAAFLELFSGSLAQSYENDAIAARETRFAERAEAAPEPKQNERVEPERRSERFEVERSEQPDRGEQSERRAETRTQREDTTAAERPRTDSTKAQTRAEASAQKQTAQEQTSQTRGETSGETERKTGATAVAAEPRDEAAKTGTTAETQMVDSKRAVAKSNAQAKALANLLNGATKSEADENVSRRVEQLVKASAKVTQQTQTAKSQAQENVVQIKSSAPETAAAAAKNAATAKVAESSAKHVETNITRPNAVQGAEAPRNNAQTGGEQQQSNSNSLAPNSLNASPVAQEAVRAAQQNNRGFASAMKEAEQSSAVNKTGASAPTSGSQVAMSNAVGQYSRAATHVFNTPRAQAPSQAQPSQVISQLIRAAKISMQNGREEMKILLKPEELGWLKVKITVEGNRVTAHFGAENEFVRGLLEGNISQLQQALQNNNLKVNQIQIDVAGQQQQGQNSQSGAAGDNNGNGKNGSTGNAGDVAEASLEESTAEELYLLQDTAALELSAVDVMI